MKKIMLMATMMVATLAASAQYDAGTWSLNVRYGFTGATMINTPDMDLSLALGPGSTINLPGGDLEASATGGHVVGLELEKQLTKRFSISGGLDWLMAGTGWKDHKWKDGDVEYKLKDASVKTHYLAVPVTANLYVWKGLALHAGVQAAYLTGARREGTVTYEDDADYTVSMSLSDRSQFNKIDQPSLRRCTLQHRSVECHQGEDLRGQGFEECLSPALRRLQDQAQSLIQQLP